MTGGVAGPPEPTPIEMLRGLIWTLGEEDERDAIEAIDQLAAVCQQVADATKLHAPERLFPAAQYAPWCRECSTGIRTHSDDGPFVHKVYWPCPTAKALGIIDPLGARNV